MFRFTVKDEPTFKTAKRWLGFRGRLTAGNALCQCPHASGVLNGMEAGSRHLKGLWFKNALGN
jgi:hypothetical protein